MWTGNMNRERDVDRQHEQREREMWTGNMNREREREMWTGNMNRERERCGQAT